MLYVFGAIDKLKEKGMVTGGRYEPSHEGHLAFEDMISNGWTPTEQEIEDVVAYINRLNCDA